LRALHLPAYDFVDDFLQLSKTLAPDFGDLQGLESIEGDIELSPEEIGSRTTSNSTLESTYILAGNRNFLGEISMNAIFVAEIPSQSGYSTSANIIVRQDGRKEKYSLPQH